MGSVATEEAKPKVLVVDDDEASRVGLARGLGLFGYDCRTAEDGEDAWEKHLADPADIIVSDWRMPRLDGVELCRRTRAQSGAPYTYFVLLTAWGDSEHLIRGMEAGADDYQTKPIALAPFAARLKAAERIVSAQRKLEEENRALQIESRRAHDVARVDALTHVGNRLRMDEELEGFWARARRYRLRVSAAFCDIDWFKKYNDRFGHLAGDDVLRRVAESLRRGLRQGDCIYRYGGEEFLLVFPEQGRAEAALAANRLRAQIAALGIDAGDGAPLTVSIGVAELDCEHEASVEEWLKRADEALYRAKSLGRNRVECAEPR